MFAGIKSLLPGHYLRIRNGELTQHAYWDVSFAKEEDQRTEGECVEELKSLLQESVKLRLRSDVPFGAFLSGGLDSSTIVGLMSRELREPVKTFSVGFQEGVEQDELPYAREVAKRFGCVHHEILVTARDFVDQAERVIWHLDQPIADQATMATYMVAQLASQHVKMVLTGEGGDELFAGYARYAGEQFSPWLRHLPNSAGAILRSTLPSIPGLRRQKIALYALTLRDETRRFTNWFPLFNDATRQHVLIGELRERVGVATHAFAKALARCDARLPLNRMLYVDSKLWLPDYLLLRGDKLTMAHSLEGRVPLLDHKLVEFAATLPPQMKLHGKTRKYLLKRAASELLPEGIINRKKQGFPIPIASWMRNEARSLVHDLLSPQTVQRRGLFDVRYVNRLLTEHDRGFADHAMLLWGLASLELWQRVFVPTS
jgi:asparagine synthase (glutamine-hydrolysing)